MTGLLLLGGILLCLGTMGLLGFLLLVSGLEEDVESEHVSREWIRRHEASE